MCIHSTQIFTPVLRDVYVNFVIKNFFISIDLKKTNKKQYNTFFFSLKILKVTILLNITLKKYKSKN